VQFVGGGTSRPFGTFDPLNAGTTDLTIIQPVGFDVPANQNATITATVSAPLINFADSTVGDDLQLNVSASLAQAPPVATDVTFTVADLSVAVISTNPATPGGADITILGVTGTGLGSITVQGLQQGSTTITVTAAGYQTRVATVTVVPSGFSWLSGDLATTTFSNPSTLSMRSVRLAPGTLNFVQEQSVRAGLNVDVVVTNSDTNVGTVTSPYLFTGGGTSRPAGTFDPLNAGTADLTIIQPVGFDVPANQNATITATVSAPLINFADPIVGDDLQLEVIASLAQAPPVATDVMFTVGDPSVAVISTNPATPGGADITIPGVTNTGLGNITVQGLQQGNTTITVTAAGYQTRVATVTVDPSGFSWLSGDLATTTFSNPSNLFMRSVRLAPGTLNFAGEQPVRAGLNVNVVVTNSDTNVGTITSPYLFTGGGTSRPSGTFDPLTAGTTDLTIIQPAGFDIPSNQAQTISATVDAPDITISGNLVVGLDLQMNTNISLQVAPPSPTDVTITVASGTIATISDDGLVEGSASITIPNVSGTLVCNCLIQGRSLGSTLITAQAGGYNDGTNNVTVDPSGFTFPFTSSITTTAGGGNTSIQMRSSRLNPVTLNRVNDQSVRGGLTVSVNVSNSNPTAGTLTVNPVVFTPNTFLQTTQFDPDAAGVTIINIQTPPGFSTPSNAQQIDVTVNP
ncbi:MAG: PEGA domain-containing protein, partial [Gammaproteobacteria bacterium]|nr:PEGA domain-containing protein [Gammaproteobacteria bacterium]